MDTGTFQIINRFLSLFVLMIQMGFASMSLKINMFLISQFEDKIRLFAHLCRFFGYLIIIFLFGLKWIPIESRYTWKIRCLNLYEYSPIMAKIRVNNCFRFIIHCYVHKIICYVVYVTNEERKREKNLPKKCIFTTFIIFPLVWFL